MIGLAPMEGVTEFPFRRWLSLCSSPGYHSTPFLRVTHTYPSSEFPVSFAPEIFDPDYSDLETPVVAQLMGPSPSRICEVGSLLLEKTSSFDINFGCPAPTVVGKGSGSALLADVDSFNNFVGDVYKNFSAKQFSIKIRTGYENSENYKDIISCLKSYNLEKLTIHGRTKSQKYMGLADWSLIEHAAKSLSYPVIGSGDITNKDSYKERKEQSPSVSGVIVGRAALKNPWIFSQLEKWETKLNLDTILYALATYGIFVDVFFNDGYDKFKAVDNATGQVQKPLKTSEDWESYLRKVGETAFNLSNFEDFDMSRRALSRMKMIWTYLKELMPSEFQGREILRAKSFKELIEQYKVASANYQSSSGRDSVFLN